MTYAAARTMKGRAAVATAMLGAMLVLQPGSAHAQAQTPETIAGDWATEGLRAVVRLSACEDNKAQLCGTLTWAWEPTKLKPGSVGKPMLWGFSFDKQKWRGGQLKNPEDGNTYVGEIWLEGQMLRLKGCAGPFCKSQTWRRLSDIPRPDAK